MDMIEQKGRVLLPVIAYGDAAGLPVETQSAEQIREKYGVIKSLLPSNENPFFIGEHDPGMWSDDTQLSMAVAKGLIVADGFDLNTMAQAHIIAYDETEDLIRDDGRVTKRGWGGSTVDAVRKLKAGVSPLESGTKEGAGNGVLMKMAPLAYWHVARNILPNERYENYDALTTMTHDSDIARLTTRVHGDMLQHLMENGYKSSTFLEELTISIAYHEAITNQEGQLSELMAYLTEVRSPDDVLENTDAKGFYAPQTLAMAYGAFILNAGRFIGSVYEAVNLGGDTDSTGSIVAVMSAFANRNIVRIPIDHQTLDQLPLLKKVSKDLALRALGLVEAT